ncbi:hypothetical protein E2C01_060516 [Portunus trituberculatus]|uniref:Uncharacterized protein n=1 Tax=Portunus trituberculatus TaxID=210409 RepID=A0A5B7H992_PORTR|nr:hypothetical protein [Portunus trituberculatus]
MAKFSEVEFAIIAIILDEEEEAEQKVKKSGYMKRGRKDKLKESLRPNQFVQYFRMSKNCFWVLFSKMETQLKKQDTHWRKAIKPEERVEMQQEGGRRGTVEPCVLWDPIGLQAHGFESCPRSV